MDGRGEREGKGACAVLTFPLKKTLVEGVVVVR